MNEPVKLVPDSTYPSMFWLVWEDGTKSADFYNKTRAKQHLRDVLHNIDPPSSVECHLNPQRSSLVRLNVNMVPK